MIFYTKTYTAVRANLAKTMEKVCEDHDAIIITRNKEQFVRIGKPELLKHGFKGYWSRRITEEHRFVYKVVDDAIIIPQLRYHY